MKIRLFGGGGGGGGAGEIQYREGVGSSHHVPLCSIPELGVFIITCLFVVMYISLPMFVLLPPPPDLHSDDVRVCREHGQARGRAPLASYPDSQRFKAAVSGAAANAAVRAVDRTVAKIDWSSRCCRSSSSSGSHRRQGTYQRRRGKRRATVGDDVDDDDGVHCSEGSIVLSSLYIFFKIVTLVVSKAGYAVL